MKANFIFSILVVSLLEIQAQAPTIEWQKCYGGSAWDFSYSMQQTSDGGYIMAGNSKSTSGDVSGNHGLEDIWVLKIDSIGNIIWQKSFGGSGYDNASSIQQTFDEGYVIIGYTDSYDGDVTGNHGGGDSWVVKLDTLGNILWQKCLGGTDGEFGNSIQQTSDGGYIVASNSASINGDVSGNHGISDYWVVKLDSLGNIVWENSLGGSSNEFVYSIKQNLNGGYIIAGLSYSNDGDISTHLGDGDYWVVMLDSNGNIGWEVSLGGSDLDQANSIIQSLDGGYIVAGRSRSTDGNANGWNGNDDYLVIKIDSNGNFIWSKCFGGTGFDEAYSVKQTADGSFVVTGTTTSFNGDVIGIHGFLYDYWVIKLDSNGDLLWQKCLGGTDQEYSNSIQQTQDGGYVLAGAASSIDGDVTGNHGSYDFWIVKLAPDSSVITKEKQNTLGVTSLTLYPNPASEILTLELEGPSTGSGIARISTYQITDLQGRIVLKGVVEGIKTNINVAGLAKGVYIIDIEAYNISHKLEKLVVE